MCLIFEMTGVIMRVFVLASDQVSDKEYIDPFMVQQIK